MADLFDLATRIYHNAEIFSATLHCIPEYPPVEELMRETGRWFAEMGDDSDEDLKQIRMKIWSLRAHFMYSLIPFDAGELNIRGQLLSLQREVHYFPFLKERMDRLSRIVDFLIETPLNPKREMVFELLREAGNDGQGVGIVAALIRGTTPGWNRRLEREIRRIAPDCEFVLGSKALKQTTYRQVILPSSGRLSPVFHDLYNGCRAQRLDIVAYRREGVFTPSRGHLPKGNYVRRAPIKPPPGLQQLEPESKEIYLDEWAQRRFWESLRGEHNRGLPTILHDGEFLINARIVILASNQKVYLREDMSIIEISELVEGPHDSENDRKRFPRRRVDELREGDLIVLRTSGSGEYLVDFANSMMEADGKGNLRAAALDWKPVLKEALTVHGTAKIASLLVSKGHTISNHRYIWMWTTDLVIRPQSQSLFQDLINILFSLGFRIEEGDPFAAADKRWKKMKEIIRYHARAGQRIRRALLERLEKLISDRITITDCYHLSLPHLSAGEISVFRVAAVDTESIEIPYHHTGVITSIEN